MAVSFNVNIDKIVFTSPYMPSPSPAGQRSHIIPNTLDLGTWYENGASMYRAASSQNITDIASNLGVDRPVFGYSGIVSSGTTYQDGIENYIYVYTTQDWLITTPFNLYLEDNSWCVITDVDMYQPAPDPPTAPALSPTVISDSSSLTSTRDVYINGCVCSSGTLNYIFNTNQLYSVNLTSQAYTIITNSPYTIDYPVTMVAKSGTIFIFYLDNNMIRCASYTLSTSHWTMNAYILLQSNITTITELESSLIDSNVYISPKYTETTIPIHIYTYIYNTTNNSWSYELIDVCGDYNLTIAKGMLNNDGTYLYLSERDSKLVHKLHLTTKQDSPLLNYKDSDSTTSSIYKDSKIYTYIYSSNTFNSLTTDGQTQVLTSPTLDQQDASNVLSTTLSTDGTYLYLAVNKDVQWDNITFLYQYDISGNSWNKVATPMSGSANTVGTLCANSTNMFCCDETYIYKLDNTYNKWYKLTTLPRTDAQNPVICSDDTYIYAVLNLGGYFWRYTISSDTWDVLQTISLPNSSSYNGTSLGNLLINSSYIYLGLNYNYVSSSEDTFCYRYHITQNAWSSHVMPNPNHNRGIFTFFFTYNSSLLMGGYVQYLNNPISVYRYTVYKQTNEQNNTWSLEHTIDLNSPPNPKYLCIHGQATHGDFVYINYTSSSDLNFQCTSPECRKLDLSSDTSSYWLPNPITTMYILTTSVDNVFYLDTTTGIFYTYNITSSTTTAKAIPTRSYVNYSIYYRGSTKYLFGQQEIEYNPSLYKYKFIVYRQSGSGWAVVSTHEQTSSTNDLTLNPIQEYCGVYATMYMIAYTDPAGQQNGLCDPNNLEYDINSQTLSNLSVDLSSRSITSTDSNTLMLVQHNTIVNYNIPGDSTTLFIDGTSGNRSAAFTYVYKQGSAIKAIGGQFVTATGDATYLTYERSSGSWSRAVEHSISSTFFDALSYAKYGNNIYCLNTGNHTIYNTTTDTIGYVSNYPQYTGLCCSGTSGNLMLYSNLYSCPNYVYNNVTFTEFAGDISRTSYASNTTLTTSGTLAFIKNNVTSEISYIDVYNNLNTTVTTDLIFGETPFIFMYNTHLYALLPKHKTLTRINGTTTTTIVSNINISAHCTAVVNNNTLYYTTGQYSFNFYKMDLNTHTITQLETLPHAQGIYTSITSYNDTLILIHDDLLYYYDIISNSWSFIQTLPEKINYKGIYVHSDFIFYAGINYIYKIRTTTPELKNTYYSPVSSGYANNFVLLSTLFILHDNLGDITPSCSTTHTSDRITVLDLSSITSYPPTSVPYNLTLEDSTEKHVTISWKVTSTHDITHYRIYRQEHTDDKKLYVGQSTILTFTDTTANRGKVYYYSIRSCNEYGCTADTSTLLYVKVAGSEFKYKFTTSVRENAQTPGLDIGGLGAYRWGNSNLDFDTSVIFTTTFGEAYDCFITAWDDETHSTTNNPLLKYNSYRISACAFTSGDSTSLVEPDYKALYFKPVNNCPLQGNNHYYGTFNIVYEPDNDRHGAFIFFKPVLINLPTSHLTKGNYEFITSLHYKYT